jgi:hypothetical protein
MNKIKLPKIFYYLGQFREEEEIYYFKPKSGRRYRENKLVTVCAKIFQYVW